VLNRFVSQAKLQSHLKSCLLGGMWRDDHYRSGEVWLKWELSIYKETRQFGIFAKSLAALGCYFLL